MPACAYASRPGRRDLGERRVVVLRVGVARAVAGDERQRLDVDRLVGVLQRVLGPHDDRGGRTVGDTGAVVHAEPTGHERRVADGLHRDFLAELRPRVAGAVVVVLPRDAGEHLAHLRLVEAVLLAVAGRAHREHRGRGERAAGAVGRRLGRADEALVAAVLDLLDADRHRDVVRAARDRVRGVAQRLRRGRAEVLDVRDRLVVQLQRTGERHAAHARHRGAEPVRVDVVLRDAGRGEGGLVGVDEEIVGALVPLLAERRAAHADDGDAVLDAV